MSNFLYGYLPQLLLGTYTTIKVALCSLLLGLLIGLIGAAGESIKIRWLRYLFIIFISIIRGLPELLVIFFIYFGGTIILSNLMNHYVNVSAFMAGVLALSLLFGAYASQTFRGAFHAIPVGQIEAGKALGLNKWQVFYHIRLPQACKHALPGLSNLWLVLLKDSALISLIGLADVMNKTQVAASTTHKPFTFYLAAAVIYLVLTYISQIFIKQLTNWTNRPLNS